jgi:hypothetical protein
LLLLINNKQYFIQVIKIHKLKHETPAVLPLPSKVNLSRSSGRVCGGFRHVFPRGCAVKNVAEKNTAPVRLRFAV